jgi:hypothetical protein
MNKRRETKKDLEEATKDLEEAKEDAKVEEELIGDLDRPTKPLI